MVVDLIHTVKSFFCHTLFWAQSLHRFLTGRLRMRKCVPQPSFMEFHLLAVFKLSSIICQTIDLSTMLQHVLIHCEADLHTVYQRLMKDTVITLIIQTIQLFKHPPPFQEKLLFQAFEHPRLKLLFQYRNTYTLRSSNGGRRMSTSLRQSLWSYSEGYRMSSSILQAFSNVYQTTTVISKKTACTFTSFPGFHIIQLLIMYGTQQNRFAIKKLVLGMRLAAFGLLLLMTTSSSNNLTRE